MKKLFEFLKTNFLIAEWTVLYCLVLWVILHYLFGFDMFSKAQWWRFFHARLHGFIGFVFCVLIYSAIPIYLASIRIIYHTKKPLFTIPICDRILARVKTMFIKPEAESEPEAPEEPDPESEYPEDLPHELRAPFIRMKQRLSLKVATSSFNKSENNLSVLQPVTTTAKPDTQESETEAFPIPTDFDIGDSLPDTSVPTFTEINFDEPQTPISSDKITNSVTKYFDEHNTEYETHKDFIITAKNIIYTHDDPDFWITDNEAWFAAGKQHNSPVNELLELSKETGLTPVIYFESTNIMDFNGAVQNLTEQGIKVITDLSELN